MKFAVIKNHPFLHDLTQKETAERLGISAVTVSRRVKSGLKRLRDLMAPTEENEKDFA